MPSFKRWGSRSFSLKCGLVAFSQKIECEVPVLGQVIKGTATVLARAAITKYHKLGGLDKHVFLMVLEAGKLKIKVPVDSVFREISLPGLQIAALSPCAHVAEEGWAPAPSSSYKGTSPKRSGSHPHNLI